MRHDERHRTDRIGWLRAAVLGANDGIVSTFAPQVWSSWIVAGVSLVCLAALGALAACAAVPPPQSAPRV